MKQEQRLFLYFTAAFLAIIYTVPIAQAVVEYKKYGTIHALDIVADATITPYRRAVRCSELYRKLSRQSDTLAEKNKRAGPMTVDQASQARLARLSRIVDDALQTCGELKNATRTINRHVSIDSSGPDFFIFDTVSHFLGKLQQNANDDPEAISFTIGTSADDLHEAVKRLAGKYPQPGMFDALWICLKTFKYIFWNDRYIRPFEKELDDNSIFASAIRPLVLHARYIFFRDLGEKGIWGRNQWMFYTPDVEFLVKPSMLDPRSIQLDPNNRPLAVSPVDAICRFQHQLADRGIDLLVVIVPGKPSIYADLLSKTIKHEQAAALGHSPAMVGELRKRGVEAIDLFTPFVQERRRDAAAGDSMYLQTDTHWKGRGVRLAARVVSKRIKQYPWYVPGAVEYAVDSVVIDRFGDIAAMCALSLTGRRDRAAPWPAERTRCYQVYRVSGDAGHNNAERHLYKDDFRSSNILVLGDSFSRIYQTDQPRGAGWIAHLAVELSQPVASIVNDGGASTLVRESLKRRLNLLSGKKLVIWEIVERDFRFGAEGWKDVDWEGGAR